MVVRGIRDFTYPGRGKWFFTAVKMLSVRHLQLRHTQSPFTTERVNEQTVWSLMPLVASIMQSIKDTPVSILRY